MDDGQLAHLLPCHRCATLGLQLCHGFDTPPRYTAGA